MPLAPSGLVSHAGSLLSFPGRRAAAFHWMTPHRLHFFLFSSRLIPSIVGQHPLSVTLHVFYPSIMNSNHSEGTDSSKLESAFDPINPARMWFAVNLSSKNSFLIVVSTQTAQLGLRFTYRKCNVSQVGQPNPSYSVTSHTRPHTFTVLLKIGFKVSSSRSH